MYIVSYYIIIYYIYVYTHIVYAFYKLGGLLCA